MIFMQKSNHITITVVYATAEHQELCTLKLPQGSNVQYAVEVYKRQTNSALIDFSINKFGIFGTEVSLDHGLQEGDRVEVYRVLSKNPKHARRKLAQKGDTMGRK